MKTFYEEFFLDEIDCIHHVCVNKSIFKNHCHFCRVGVMFKTHWMNSQNITF